MPLVSIDVLEGHSSDELDAISIAVHDAIVEFLDVPERDHFQIITDHAPSAFRFDRHYLDIDRSNAFVLVGSRSPRATQSPQNKRSMHGSPPSSQSASVYEPRT